MVFLLLHRGFMKRKLTLVVATLCIASAWSSAYAKPKGFHHNHGNGNGNGYGHCKNHGECDYDYDFEVREVKGIYFQGLAGFNQVITIKPSSYDSAIFEIRGGEPYSWVKLSVKKDKLYPLDTRKTDKVFLQDYKFGGSATYDGYAMLDRHGNLDDVRLGASVKIKVKNNSQIYHGTPTLKVEYLW